MRSQITIPVTLARQLSLPRWNDLSDASRLKAAEMLVRRLKHPQWDFECISVVARFGPDREQPVVQFRERNTDLLFSLIPGGTFRRGYAPELLEIYDQLFLSLQSGDFEGPLPRHAPRRVPVIESGPSDLRLQPPVKMPPVLMAVTPLHNHNMGLDSHAPDGQDDEACTPLRLQWDAAVEVLRQFSWGLPTGAEFEWALRGGVDSLFFWGNAVPRWIAEVQCAEEDADALEVTDEISFDDVLKPDISTEDFTTWPRCNRFGLVNMLEPAAWCRTTADPDRPFLARGGAGGWHPWQYCREWMLMMNAVEVRQPTSGDVFIESIEHERTVRPVIRLVSATEASAVDSESAAARRRYLDAIAATPDEDGPRLEFADWLEEQKDPQAKLVRKQCQAAYPQCPDRDLVESAADALLVKHRAKWTAELTSRFPDATGVFHRGVLEEIVLDDSVTDEDLPQLAAFPEVRLVTLQNVGITDRGIRHLAKLPHLLEVRLVHTSVTPEGIDWLVSNTGVVAVRSTADQGRLKDAVDAFHQRRADEFPDLSRNRQRQFAVRFLRTVVDEGLSCNAASAEDNSRDITLILLGRTEIGDRELRYLTPFTKLRALQLRHTKVTSAGLAQLSALSQLDTLGLGFTDITDCSFVRRFPLLEQIDMGSGGHQLTDKDVRAVADLARLKFLVISEAAITDRSLKRFAKLTKLETLILQGEFTNDGVAIVPRLSALSRLTLDSPHITNHAFAHLAEHPALETLTMPLNSLAHIEPLESIPKLREIRFIATKRVTWERLERWAQRVPKVRVDATIRDERRVLNT